MADPALDDAQLLIDFLDGSPSPYHAVASAAALLDAAGFAELDERDEWSAVGDTDGTGRYVRRGGSLVAWSGSSIARGFRIVGAHTDSPNLRIKPKPDVSRAGARQLGVEVYGGVLLNSWLDRDLGLSGRVAVTDASGETGPELRLVKVDRPLLRIPQLAIHLDRAVNESGLVLNPQAHLAPMWGLGGPDERGFEKFLAAELGLSAPNILSWDVMLHDLTPATILGRDGELLASGRIDNLLSCWAAITALTRAADTDVAAEAGALRVVVLFDHEEIGSESASGAAGAILPTVLERIAATTGADRADFLRAIASSRCISSDGAHATHPNYSERHEPGHHIALNGGPVIKINANVRYATDAATSGWLKVTARQAGVPVQEFVVRTDMPCGSTIGPITAAKLGIPTVDIGAPQLSMHSARELTGAKDPHLLARLLTAFLTRA